MNERHRALYNYLLSRNGEWTTHAEIARELYREYGNAECCLEPKDFHNTTERTLITKDCREISISSEVDKIIISSSKGIKLANEQEHKRYVTSQYRSVLRKLKRTRIMEKKGNANGQITIDGRTIEAYLHGVDAEIEIF